MEKSSGSAAPTRAACAKSAFADLSSSSDLGRFRPIATKLSTGKMRKIPAASGSVPAVRNFETQPH